MNSTHKIALFSSVTCWLLALAVLCGAGKPYQETNTSDANTLKALFIYSFTKHIEWPADMQMSSKFVIGIYGNSPVKEKLSELMKGRKINDKTVEIRIVSSENEITDSHILFFPKNNTQKLKKIAELYAEKGLLIISEERGMIASGAGINFIEKDNHLRFELSTASLKKQGLKVSNQLQNLAYTTR